jgi:glycosyltransferase involved in cell wall biosynthesis
MILNRINDDRIILIENEVNLGLIATLNKGIGLCNGKYIARMDADDISAKDRIELQVQRMEENTQFGICGTWFETFKGSELISASKYSYSNDEIQIHQLYQIHLCHGTSIFRKEILEDSKFDKNYAHAEDFELWSRIKDKCKMTNIQAVLYKVNTHGENVSILNNDTQNKNTLRVISKQLENIVEDKISEETAILYRKLCESDFSFALNEIKKLGQVIIKLAKGSDKLNLDNPHSYENYLSQKWNHLCYNNLKKDKGILSIWKQFSPIKASIKTQLKFQIKNIL